MKNGKYVLVFVIILVLRYLQTFGSYLTSNYNLNSDINDLDHNAKIAASVNAIGAAIIVTVLYWLFDNVLFLRKKDAETNEIEENNEEEIIDDENAKEDEDHSKWIPK